MIKFWEKFHFRSSFFMERFAGKMIIFDMDLSDLSYGPEMFSLIYMVKSKDEIVKNV
jgi:hypothetical protein